MSRSSSSPVHSNSAGATQSKAEVQIYEFPAASTTRQNAPGVRPARPGLLRAIWLVLIVETAMVLLGVGLWWLLRHGLSK